MNRPKIEFQEEIEQNKQPNNGQCRLFSRSKIEFIAYIYILL